MIRVLVVVDADSSVSIADFRRVFSGVNIVIARETERLTSVLCRHDPQVIVSLGDLGKGSQLWGMPLWRRTRWLSLPEADVPADAVLMAALSLVAATSDENLFAELPLVSCVVLDTSAEACADTLLRVVGNQQYENIEILLPEGLAHGAEALIGPHRILGALRRIPGSVDASPMDMMRRSLSVTQGSYLWPVSSSLCDVGPEFLTSTISRLNGHPDAGAIIGKLPGRDSLVDSLLSGRDNPPLVQVVVRPEHVLRCRRFGHDFLLESLSALLVELLMDPSTELHEVDLDFRSSSSDLWDEPDANHRSLVRTAHAKIRHLQNMNTTQGARQ